MRHFITFKGIDSGNDLALDVSSICNSENSEIRDPRCTTSGTSAAGSASFLIGWTPDKVADPYDGTLIDRPALYQQVVDAMLTAIETKAEMQVILRDDTLKKVKFRGYIDPTEISLSRTRIPQSIAVSCRDHTTDLDKKIGYNIVREGLTVNQIVEELLELCYGNGSHVLVGTGEEGNATIAGSGTDGGATLVGIKRIVSSLPDSVIVPRFVVVADDNTTYREVIDRLLMQKAVGYVLHYIHASNKFEIVPAIPDEVDDLQIRTINFMPQGQLVTRTGVYNHDGVLVRWPTIEERENDNVYSEDIEITHDANAGNIGTIVQQGAYFPEDGDITPTKQEYRRSDREYVTGSSRVQNRDIELLYAKDAELGIIAVPVKMTNRGTVADLDTLEALSNPVLGDYAYVTSLSEYRGYNGSDWQYMDTPTLSDGIGSKYTDKGTKSTKSALPSDAQEGDFYLCVDTGLYWCWMDNEWQRKISLFCFPVLSTTDVNMTDGNPAFYPRSMWALGRNRSGGLANLQALSVTATSVARTKVNKTTHPATIKDPDEYEAEYVNTQEEAESFSLWLYNFRRIACTTCTWYEWEGQKTPLSKLGERVRVEYMTDSTAVFCVIQIDDTAVTRKSRKYKVTALLVSGFHSAFSGKHEAVIKPTESVSVVDIRYYYALTESASVPPADNAWTEGQSTALGQTVWKKTVTTYSDGKVDEQIEIISGYSLENEQILSVSDAVCSVPTPAPTEWRRGLYVWQRTKLTDENGNVSYGTPIYSQKTTASLYDSCRFEIVATSPTWDRNYADSRNTDLAFRIIADGFANDAAILASLGTITITPYKNGTAQSPVTVNPPAALAFTVPIRKNTDWDSLTITAINSNIVDSTIVWTSQSASATMSANDITKYDVFGGTFATDALADAWFLANSGGVLDGYSYVDSTLHVVKVYANDIWNVLDLNDDFKTGTILTKAEADLWEMYDNMTPEEKNEAFSLYGYKAKIIAHCIATAQLRMYGEAVIASGDIDFDPAEDIDVNGYLTKPGYRFEGRDPNGQAGGMLRSNGCRISNGYFKHVEIDEESRLRGEVATDVFETVLQDEQASRCLASSPASDGEAQGVLGSEVKAYLQAYFEDLLGNSHSSLDVDTISDVALNPTGNRKTGATKVMLFSGVSSSLTSLSSGSALRTDQDTTIQWTNSYPVNVVLRPIYRRNVLTYKKQTGTSVTWTKIDDGHAERQPWPNPTDRPANPLDGDTWTDYADIVSRGGGLYDYNYVVFEADVSPAYTTYTRDGDVEYWIGNTKQATLQSTVDIPAGSSFRIIIKAVALEADEIYVISESLGSGNIRWKESENFSNGILFVKNASRSDSFYLSSLDDGVWDDDVTLYHNDESIYALELGMDVEGYWTFVSGYGNGIHKLFKFAWTSYSAGMFTAFSSKTSATITDMNGTTKSAIAYMRTILTAAVTSNSLDIGYGRSASDGVTGTLSVNADTYLRSYRIDFTPLSRTKGIKGMEMTPFATDTYDMGTSTYRWKGGYFKTIYSDSQVQTSARKNKESILPYKENALELIKSIDIVSYMLKSEHGDKKAYRRYGFIADNSPEEVASPFHDRMDTGSCIGILMKGMQELAAKIEELKNRS